MKCSWQRVYVPHPICAQDHFSPENKFSFSIRIWFISSISHLAYNLVVDEENEKEQEENPESQVQLLKQVFRQNFHFGVEICSFFSNLCLSPQKLTPPLFLTAHVTTPFLLQHILPEAFGGVWQILQRNSESVCLAFNCGKKKAEHLSSSPHKCTQGMAIKSPHVL